MATKTSTSGVGVILLQLGTPDAPTTPAVRRYLREFLEDPRVVDLNRALWLPILYGAVLTRRPSQSAKLYQKVWTPEGSPLLVTTKAQASELEARLTKAAGKRVPVVVGMRYGNPSIAAALDELTSAGVDRILAFPMYPQYAGATTGSSLEKLFAEAGRRRIVASLRIVPPYFAHPAYITALGSYLFSTRTGGTGTYLFSTIDDRSGGTSGSGLLLLSYHGLPKRYAEEGDPYPEQCAETTRLLVESLGPKAPKVEIVFQSRFGREEWLQPYLDVRLEELGRAKTPQVAVAAPGFTADCLETIEEIGIRGAEQFHEAGGGAFTRVPCLNTQPAWIDAMETLATQELGGWI